MHAWLLLSVGVVHLFICPYTKVEESFNVQATHDLMYHRTNISAYDHLEFPGVVPRTFVGPVCLAAISYPFALLQRVCGFRKYNVLLCVRFVLGCLIFSAFRSFARSVAALGGSGIAFWMSVVSVSQFHFIFYMTRPLPNVLALFLVLLSLSCFYRKSFMMSIWFACFAVILFRCELVLLFAPLFIPVLVKRPLMLRSAISHGFVSSVCALLLTVVVDSLFWRHLLWPEGEVWWYNVVLNKSKDWGTSPFHWYFTSALPRALCASIAMVLVGGVVNRKVLTDVLLPAFVFIFIYSFLPHKELRFIIYTIPMFNVSSASGCAFLWNCRKYRPIFRMVVITHLLINIAFTSVSLYVSSYNYPGGYAMRTLHDMESNSKNISVHIDVYCAETGISRFLHENDNWRYSKIEGLPDGGVELLEFDYLLVGRSDDLIDVLKRFYRFKFYKEYDKRSHGVVKLIDGFHKISVSGKRFPSIVIQPKAAILERI